jgi:hypothetical protein
MQRTRSRFQGLATLAAFQAENGSDEVDENNDDLSLAAFQQAKQKQQQQQQQEASTDNDDFDGYALRNVILAKWGESYDVDFNRVDAFGFRKLYLNVMPYRLGRRPFRHATEYDYLCHLQAVVEILKKYEQLENVLSQIDETTKKPMAGRIPIIAVPIRLDLTREQVDAILG